MANQKITDLTEKVNVIDEDWVEIVDTEDTTDSPEGTSKKAKRGNVKGDITINSIITGEPTGSDQVINVVSLTQAEYDAGTPITTTFYIITDA